VADDIVTRLRIIHCAADDLTPCGTCLICEAADEIERLRHIIEAVNTYLYVNAFSGPNEDGDEDNNYPIIRMEIWFQQLLKEEASRG
jgi:hypothetical protein